LISKRSRSSPGLADLLRAEGGLIGEAVVEPQAPAAQVPDRFSLLFEAILEGYRLHYGEGAVVRPGDPDLALLAGDRLYALGLERLAELGDLDAVRLLADAISECAQAHAEGRDAEAPGIWDRTAAALSG
jgi:hypothetical protein